MKADMWVERPQGAVGHIQSTDRNAGRQAYSGFAL